jgi:hypothetical protein
MEIPLPSGGRRRNHHPLFLPQLTNSGFKVWQLRKIDGQWKILSLTWTSYDRS